MSAHDDLLVFGYSCKLFREDEKAMYIDQGKHLVPWMNDSNLLLDRFDVRGALYDLTDAESKGEGYEHLTEAEQKEELICDQERYFYLYHDESEQITQEEEIKRLQVDLATDDSYYNQVGFDYTGYINNDGQQQPVHPGFHQDPNRVEVPQVDSHFKPVVDEETYIPPPELNVPDGMEVPRTVKQNKIIIKTAKFIVTHGAQMEIVIKTKQSGNSFFNFLSFEHPLNAYYKHVVFMLRMGKYKWEDELDELTKDQDSRYLHPDLSQSVRPDLTPGVSSPSSSSPHCSYSKLITKIREKQMASGLEDSEVPSPVIPSSPVIHPSPEMTPDRPSCVVNKHAPIEPFVGLVDYPSFSHTADGTSDVEDSDLSSPNKKTAFSRSNSLRLQSHDYSKIKWPPPELQMVIDKMASYITKNGSAFEEVVRNRDDPRFEFLKPTHEFHPYYQCKIQLYNEVYGDFFKNSNKIQESKKKIPSFSTSNRKEPNCHSKPSSNNRTISFSIKSREQEVALSNNTTFPIESSTSEEDEDMDEEEKERRRYEREQRYQAKKRKEKEEKERKEQESMKKISKEKRRQEKGSDEETSGNEDLYDIFKYAQEMENEKSRQRHSPSNSSHSQVKQLERKKKAAAFLSKINKGSKKEKKTTKVAAVYGPSLPPDAEEFITSESPLQSPSSRSSSEDSSKASQASSSLNQDPKRPPPPPSLPPPLPPPPPTPKRASSPLGLTQALSSFEQLISARVESSSPRLISSKESSSSSVSSKLLSEHKEDAASTLEGGETCGHKSRSRRKHSRAKSSSRSPSSKKEKKKRKRSHGRSRHRKKQRSRSRSKSKGHSRSHRSSHHKKKSKHSSHKDKEKSRKKKHRKQFNVSLSSSASSLSLSSSGSQTPSSPSSLILDSASDNEVQVIDSQEPEDISSRSSSVVSLPPSSLKSTNSNSRDDKLNSKGEGYSSRLEENSSSLPPNPVKRSTLSLIPEENSNSLRASSQFEKKTPFDPSTSNAVAKITQGLRAKLQALLEK